MKTTASIILIAISLLVGCTRSFDIVCENAETDCRHVCNRVPSWAHSAAVEVNGTDVASQIDTLDGDRQVAFVFDAVEGANRVKIRFGRGAQKSYEARVAAQMFLKADDGRLLPRRSIEEFADTMYNRLHHHGPAFESELVAYRIYFDRKQTTDLYGKRHHGLELAKTLWYPTDSQLDEGAGDDIIRVFGSVGVGTLKGWDSDRQKAVHITPFARREARIVASGPLRTIVEMRVEGWQYCGRTIDLTSRYTLWAGARECEVENRFEGDYEGLTFCTGVMKMAEHRSHLTDRALAVWGTDYPVNDTLKFAKQTCGIVVWPPAGERVEDKLNYLVLLSPDADGVISYRMSFVSAKEEEERWSQESFFDYTDRNF